MSCWSSWSPFIWFSSSRTSCTRFTSELKATRTSMTLSTSLHLLIGFIRPTEGFIARKYELLVPMRPFAWSKTILRTLRSPTWRSWPTLISWSTETTNRTVTTSTFVSIQAIAIFLACSNEVSNRISTCLTLTLRLLTCSTIRTPSTESIVDTRTRSESSSKTNIQLRTISRMCTVSITMTSPSKMYTRCTSLTCTSPPTAINIIRRQKSFPI